MRKRLVACCMLIFCLVLGVQIAEACTPAEWSFDTLSEEAAAVVYGKVLSAGKENREAIVEVIHYVGGREAPGTIHLPATVSSRRSEEDMCPDFSTTFVEGNACLIFLREDDAAPELLYRDRMTVLETTDGVALADMRGKQVEVSALLQQFAANHHLTVSEPASNADDWGKKGKGKLAVSTAIIIAVAAGTALGVRYILKRKVI
ncbi:hypothetical protein EBB07_15250 [Paenibacillaceae bacterium]|nr:hypothetical protein EBB07_15250 [Paenibacillaceae bacterium]